MHMPDQVRRCLNWLAECTTNQILQIQDPTLVGNVRRNRSRNVWNLHIFKSFKLIFDYQTRYWTTMICHDSCGVLLAEFRASESKPGSQYGKKWSLTHVSIGPSCRAGDISTSWTSSIDFAGTINTIGALGASLLLIDDEEIDAFEPFAELMGRDNTDNDVGNLILNKLSSAVSSSSLTRGGAKLKASSNDGCSLHWRRPFQHCPAAKWDNIPVCNDTKKTTFTAHCKLLLCRK